MAHEPGAWLSVWLCPVLAAVEGEAGAAVSLPYDAGKKTGLLVSVVTE